MINLTRHKLLFPAKAHSSETFCLFFAVEHNFDFLFYCAVIADYHDMTLGEGCNCIRYRNRAALTDALNGGHFLCIGSLRRFQNGDDGAIRVLTSNSLDDGFIVGREAICTIVLIIADEIAKS